MPFYLCQPIFVLVIGGRDVKGGERFVHVRDMKEGKK